MQSVGITYDSINEQNYDNFLVLFEQKDYQL